MRFEFERRHVAPGLVVAALMLATPRIATACGCNCAPPQPVGSPVPVGTAINHRVVLAVSADHTVMWDQFVAAGDQTSFTWLFPVRDAHAVEVTVGSEAFVDALDRATATTLQALTCATTGPVATDPPVPTTSTTLQASPALEASPVEVSTIDGTDPENVIRWISDHGYEDPAVRSGQQMVQPRDGGAPGGPFPGDAVRGYAGLHMDFIAVRFAGTTQGARMPPVRLSFVGYDPTLPLRGIAVGGSSQISVSLIVLAPTGMQSQNYSSVLLPRVLPVIGLDANQVYQSTLSQLFDANDHGTWIIESAAPMSLDALLPTIREAAGQADAGVSVAAAIDDAHLAFDPFGGSPVVTRMQARLTTALLGEDLMLGPGPAHDIPTLHQFAHQVTSTFPDGGLRCPGGRGDAGVWNPPSRGCQCSAAARATSSRERPAVAALFFAAMAMTLARGRRQTRGRC